jgi:purine-binding chemotaxis protein CheW
VTSDTMPAAADTIRRAQECNKYLTFTLGRQTLGLEISAIREILGYREPTAVCRMPHQVRGVINLRGSVVPVLDLAVRFGRQPNPVGKKACILIIESAFKGERHVLGVIVDAVSEVVTIAASDIEPAPAFGGAIRAQFLHGLVRLRGRFVSVLAPGSVFDMVQLAALVAATADVAVESAAR